MREGNVIDINMDRKCEKCGKPCATQSNLCLECVEEKMKHKLEPIGKKTIKAIGDQAVEMLKAYLLNLNVAYRNEKNLKIGLAIEIQPGTANDLIVTTKINFVESRVKDESKITINEAQGDLFAKKADTL